MIIYNNPLCPGARQTALGLRWLLSCIIDSISLYKFYRSIWISVHQLTEGFQTCNENVYHYQVYNSACVLCVFHHAILSCHFGVTACHWQYTCIWYQLKKHVGERPSHLIILQNSGEYTEVYGNMQKLPPVFIQQF